VRKLLELISFLVAEYHYYPGTSNSVAVERHACWKSVTRTKPMTRVGTRMRNIDKDKDIAQRSENWMNGDAVNVKGDVNSRSEYAMTINGRYH
jgi:hypothetical protein